MSVSEYRGFDHRCDGRVNEITSRIAHINIQFQNFPGIDHAQHMANYRDLINRNLQELQGIMDSYINEFFSDAPVEVTRRSLVFCLRNLIIESVQSKRYRYITAEQLALCTFTETTFVSLFAENLTIPRHPANWHPPDPGTPPYDAKGPRQGDPLFGGDHGPSDGDDFHDRDPDKSYDLPPPLPVFRGDERNAEPRGSERGVGSAMRYHTIILENIHRRLSALEQRMGHSVN